MAGPIDRLSDPSLHVSSAVLIILDMYGMEALQWEPETIYSELESAGVRVTAMLADKINAGISAINSDIYFKSVEAFTSINSVIGGKLISGHSFNAADLDDIVKGCTEVRLLLGKDIYDKSGYSHEVAIYAGSLLSMQGITRPPSILAFAEFDPGELDRMDATLSGDPIGMEAYMGRQDAEKAQLEKDARNHMASVINQIAEIPFIHGKPQLPEEQRNENTPD